jgi:hypothetical protein
MYEKKTLYNIAKDEIKMQIKIYLNLINIS